MTITSYPPFYIVMRNYFRLKRDPRDLYRGSDDEIIDELKAWVARRKASYKGLIDWRYHSLKSLHELYKSPDKCLEPGYIDEISKSKARAMCSVDGANAIYLLDTLKSRGFIWLDLWWRPDLDGAVCSLLGSVDSEFDAQATLTMLEARESREKLQAFAEKMAPMIRDEFACLKAKLGILLNEEDIATIASALTEESDVADDGRPPIWARDESGSLQQ